jgi:amino acid permease
MFDQFLTALAPSILVITVLFLVYNYFLNRHFDFAKTKSQNEITLPLLLQAHERLALFLERIKPENILTRLPLENMSVKELQSSLVSEIRNELNHNVAQQIYVNPKTWELITLAANSTINELNNKLNEDSSSENSKNSALKILLTSNLACNNIIKEALTSLKADLKNYF